MKQTFLKIEMDENHYFDRFQECKLIFESDLSRNKLIYLSVLLINLKTIHS